MEHVDCIVAGAGVVGLAVARALARSGRDVLLLEREGVIGSITSSRNSEVIHAGLYYETGSLKASSCVEGLQALYEYAGLRGIPHKAIGKLIVAQDDAELVRLEALAQRGVANGVEGLTMLSASAALRLEPALTCVGALHSASTGIIDSHAFMLALQGDLEAAGGMVVCHAPVEGGETDDKGVTLRIGSSDPIDLRANLFVNAAGLDAAAITRSIKGIPASLVPDMRWCKGNYFVLAGRSPFERLIYPAPVAHGLGIHLTLDMGGQARFGPDTEWVDTPSYDVDPARADEFYAAVRRYWPGLPDGALKSGYSGIRPKIFSNDQAYPDFVIRTPSDHGTPVIALYGIESPGLTAALALGDMIAAESRHL